MKIFAEVNTLLTIIGVFKLNHAKAALLNRIHRILIIVSLAYFICAYSYHMIFESDTIVECLESCGILSAVLYVFSAYFVFLWQQNAFQDSMETINAITRQRSQQCDTIQAIYEGACEDLEYLTRTTRNILYKYIIPFHTVPLAIQSYAQYYVMHMGEAAFQLPYPTSFVLDAKK